MSMDTINNLIMNYIDEANTVIKNQKPLSGIFGLKGSISKDPCHSKFYDTLSKEINEGDYDPFEVSKVLLTADRDFSCSDSIRFMLTAVQGLIIPLVPMLTAEQKAELKSYFDTNIKRYNRVPIQDQLYNALKK